MFSSKIDLTKGGKAKLSKEEQRGYALFRGKGKCAACHVANGRQPLFTDYTFDNLGIPKNPENPMYTGNPAFVAPGLGGFLATRPITPCTPTRTWASTVPMLRNVALVPEDVTKAYGHNGYFKTLAVIVNFYNTCDVKPTCPGVYTEAQALAATAGRRLRCPPTSTRAELGDLGLTPTRRPRLSSS